MQFRHVGLGGSGVNFLIGVGEFHVEVVLQSAEKRDPSQRKIHQRSKVARRQITGFQGEGIFVRLAQTLNVDQPARRRKSQPGSHCRLILSDFGGPAFKRQMSVRGLALGDFSNDGAVDVLISCNNEPPLLLRNNAGNRNHWLGVKLVGTKSNIDAIGARVTWQAGDLKRTVMKVGGGSYLSYHDPRLVLGIGLRSKIERIEIHWPQPSGLVQQLTDLPLDRYITIREGQAKWE